MSNLGDFIREARAKQRMSLQDVATDAGLSKPHVWDLERGASRNPTVETLLRIGAAININPNKLAALAFTDLPGVRSEPKRVKRDLRKDDQ